MKKKPTKLYNFLIDYRQSTIEFDDAKQGNISKYALLLNFILDCFAFCFTLLE